VPPTEQTMKPGPQVRRRVNWGVRAALLFIALGLATVFFIATWVQPYAPDGTPLRMASHQSLGMPACRFKEMTDMPCPSCGMTTSFALLVRGDVWNSLKANWVGTGLAVFCAFLIPWCLWSSVRGRFLWVRSIEIPMAVFIGVFTVTMLARWGIVLLLRVFD
jgi:Protein of unknown function (DUF2752)